MKATDFNVPRFRVIDETTIILILEEEDLVLVEMIGKAKENDMDINEVDEIYLYLVDKLKQPDGSIIYQTEDKKEKKIQATSISGLIAMIYV